MLNKHTVFFGACLLASTLVSCGNGDEEVSTNMINIVPGNNVDLSELPQIAFADTAFNFGRIAEGEKVKHTFEFTNNGNAPLLISRVEPSCGCTIAKDWSTAPYQPGESGVITIEFDSDKRPGHQKKTIDIITNAVPAVRRVYLEGDVAGPQTEH